MPICQAPQLMVYIDSAVTSVLLASPDTYYVVDTVMTAVTITLPPMLPVGQVITIQNAPNNGLQMGGTAPGNNVNILTTYPETFDDGTASQALGPPTSTITAAARTYYPTGGVAQAGFAGWAH